MSRETPNPTPRPPADLSPSGLERMADRCERKCGAWVGPTVAFLRRRAAEMRAEEQQQ